MWATQREEGVRGDIESVSAPCQTTEYTGTATFWRTFHYDGKICPDWWGWGCSTSPPPFTVSTIMYKVEVYAPAEKAYTVHYKSPYFYSTTICSLWVSQTQGSWGEKVVLDPNHTTAKSGGPLVLISLCIISCSGESLSFSLSCSLFCSIHRFRKESKIMSITREVKSKHSIIEGKD